MSEPSGAVRLVPLDLASDGDFEAWLGRYLRELEPFTGEPPADIEATGAGWAEEREAEACWIEADGERAGFCIVRVLPDWPDDSLLVAEIAEFYVDPAYRRRGVGQAAVEALLAEHRERGTSLVEAGVLVRNRAARRFWRAMGFEPRAVTTVRSPWGTIPGRRRGDTDGDTGTAPTTSEAP